MKKERNGEESRLQYTFDGMDHNLTRVLLPWALYHPRYLRSSRRLISGLNNAKKTRIDNRANGLRVPPALILSITNKCNLRCFGCYATAVGITNDNASNNNKNKSELTIEQWRRIISESRDLGVFMYIIAGGEPFLYPGLIQLSQEFQDRLFLIVTNGTAISESDFKKLKRTSNVAVVVSCEGNEKVTDARRGKGIYERAINTIKRLSKAGVVTGVSATITKLNYKYWMDPHIMDSFVKMGARIGVLTEYIPTTPTPDKEDNGFHALILTEKQRNEFRSKILEFKDTKRIYLIHSPGDEEFFGGCVSAGRGFAHVTPSGDLTPCPVSNIATHNLAQSSIKEGLASPLFEEIRKNDHLLETEGMPCALFAHPKEVNELAKSVGAYRTDEINIFNEGVS
jgi:MoaA/NifB/PqqE/SkfB family radical SAM enzyme